jgi:hypothetical protein
MKTSSLRIVSFFTFGFVIAAFSIARADGTDSPPRLTVELRDGSRLVGTCPEPAFRFHSVPLGDLKVNLKDIRSVERTSDTSAKLMLAGDDTLTVSYVDTTITVETKFGTQSLPVDSISKFTVQGPASTRAISPEQATAYANQCINNLRQIDAAANQFALERGKTTGDPINFPNDLTPYIRLDRNGKIPACPAGGDYVLKTVGEMPTCSLGSTSTPAHVLP